MRELLLVLIAITYMGVYMANQEDKLSKGISWFLAAVAIGIIEIFYSVFLKNWTCCCVAYQPEHPNRRF
jgi:uncharacterized membrane protein YjjB (DUF3815 family)